MALALAVATCFYWSTKGAGMLSVVLALFHASNALIPESGIAAVTLAGVAVGNMHSHVSHELQEFKDPNDPMALQG